MLMVYLRKRDYLWPKRSGRPIYLLTTKLITTKTSIKGYFNFVFLFAWWVGWLVCANFEGHNLQRSYHFKIATSLGCTFHGIYGMSLVLSSGKKNLKRLFII